MIFEPLLFILTVICLSLTIFFLFVQHFSLTYLSLFFPYFSSFGGCFFLSWRIFAFVALFHPAWTAFLSWLCFRYFSSLFDCILILMYCILFCLFSSSLRCFFSWGIFVLLSVAIFHPLWTAYLSWIILAFSAIFHILM